MKKRLNILLICLLTASLILATAGCGPIATPEPTAAPVEPEAPEPEEPTEKAEPVVMRIGNIEGPDCFNPWACGQFWFYTDSVWEGFTGFGEDCSIQNRIAKEMELSEDGLIWTLTLQEGVTFSDGEPLNAYTLEKLYDWYNATELKEWYPITLYALSWEALDELTFQITTEVPVGSLPGWGGMWSFLLPPHIWGDKDDETLYTFDNPVIGSGPYTLTDHKPGEYLIYDARSDYWGGKPAADRLVFQIFGNWDAQIQSLIAGEIDVTDRAVPAQYYDVLDADPNISLIEKDVGYKYYLSFNLAEAGIKHPAIEDVAVRRAIDNAIDKQQLIDIVLLGHGHVCPNSWVCTPYGNIVLDPTLDVNPYDPQESIRLLEEAGYLDTDGDGIRETLEGEPLEFRFLFNVVRPNDVAVSGMLVDWLDEIGIALLPEGMEEGTLLTTTRDLRDFDIAMIYYIDEIDPAGGADFFFSCWSAEAGAAVTNDSGYCSQEMDDLIYESITTIDPAERIEVAHKIGRVVARDVPIINLMAENFIQAYRNDRFEYDKVGCTSMGGLWDAPSLMFVREAE
jgi:peptide/nickel transport system substrate-binding protein